MPTTKTRRFKDGDTVNKLTVGRKVKKAVRYWIAISHIGPYGSDAVVTVRECEVLGRVKPNLVSVRFEDDEFDNRGKYHVVLIESNRLYMSKEFLLNSS